MRIHPTFHVSYVMPVCSSPLVGLSSSVFHEHSLGHLLQTLVLSIRQVSIPSIITCHPAVILCSSNDLILPLFQWLRCLRLYPQSTSSVPSPKQIKLLLMLQPVCTSSVLLGCIHVLALWLVTQVGKDNSLFS